jgi:hypothetical protein
MFIFGGFWREMRHCIFGGAFAKRPYGVHENGHFHIS